MTVPADKRDFYPAGMVMGSLPICDAITAPPYHVGNDFAAVFVEAFLLVINAVEMMAIPGPQGIGERRTWHG